MIKGENMRNKGDTTTHGVFIRQPRKTKLKSYRKNLRARWSSFIEKGKARMTVMFIPHSEKRIVTLKISVFSLAILFVFLVSVMTIAIVLTVGQIATSEELAMQSRNYEESAERLNQFMELSGALSQPISELKASIQEALMNLGGNSMLDLDLTGRGGPLEESFVLDNEHDFFDLTELRELERARYDIMRLAEKVTQINNFSSDFKKVFDHIPSIYPVMGGDGTSNIVSYFGMRVDPITHKPNFHAGIDIAAMTGTPIKAAADGEVSFAQYAPGNGNYVEIDHYWNFATRYLHLNSIAVEPGQNVKKGEIIGYCGSTGRSTGPHLHYEVRVNNKQIDPLPFIHLNPFVY